jgi:hypothetical protein
MRYQRQRTVKGITTPTVDSKTKRIPLGEDYQAVLAKYHLIMHGDARSHTVNEGMDLHLRDRGDVFEFSRISMPPTPACLTQPDATTRVWFSEFAKVLVAVV